MPQGSILCPLLFLVYIDDLPKAKEHKAIPILFADDTSILITSPNNIQFQSDIKIMFGQLNEWFKANLLSLNFDKTYFVQFTNKSICNSTYKLCIMINTFLQQLKQTFWG